MNREETLDPENWDELRALGHKMLDDSLNYLEAIERTRENPFKFAPSEAIKNISVPLTSEGEGATKVYELTKEYILPYGSPWIRPRFWGMVAGTGSPFGMLAEMLRAGVDGSNETLSSPGVVHKQVIEWIKEMLDYPKESGGVLVSGGSEANFTGLAVARNARAEVDVKTQGVQDVPRRMTIYVSDGGHHCLERSVELLGLGNNSLRWIPTDDNHVIKLDKLKDTIKEDREHGCLPFCIIGNAGTVDTGAFDDFNALADLANKEKTWFHVDGAFGAWVKISKTHRHLAEGMERADSLAVDLHKWMYMPYGVGCTLVKDRVAHYSTFVYGHEAQYLKTIIDLSKAQGDYLSNPSYLALPLSREFRSLKVYMLMRAYGLDKYSNLIQQNLDQAAYLKKLVEGDSEMELCAPVASNVVCFRFKPDGFTEVELDALNKSISDGVNKVCVFMVSDTRVKGKYCLRAAITNHRSRREDFDYIYNLVKDLGDKALQKMKN